MVSGRTRSESRLETWTTYAGILLAPFINLRIDIAFTLSSALYSLVFAMKLYRGTMPRSPLGVVAWTWFPALVLIVAGLHVSSLINGDPVRGMILTVQYGFGFLVLPFVLLRPTLDECYRMLVVFATSIVLLDLHGIATYFVVGYTPSSLVVTGNLRLATLIANPNGAACINAVAILVLVWLLAEGRIGKLLGWVYLAVTVFSLVLTSSNTGLIVVVVGLLVYGGLTFQAKHFLRLAVALCIPVGFVAGGGLDYLPHTFQKRVLAAVVEGDVSEAGTYMSRSDLNWEALDTIEKREILFLGLGADQFRDVSVQEVPVHNVFLILWVEGGILPLIGWLMLLSSGIVLWSRARSERIMRRGRAAALAAFACLLVISNARAHLYTPYLYTAMLLIMGPTLAGLRQNALSRRPASGFGGLSRAPGLAERSAV